MHDILIATYKKKLEPILDEDLNVLRKIGIKRRPFFKFTHGANSVVVYAYEEKGERLVIKLKDRSHKPFSKKIANILTKEGFGVAGLRKPPHVPPNTIYTGTLIAKCEICAWVNYDFDICLHSAIYALQKAKFNEMSKLGKAAISSLQKDMSLVGDLVGRLFRSNILYSDFKPLNLAEKDGKILFFDIHEGYFNFSNAISEHGRKAGLYLDYVKHELDKASASHLCAFLLSSFYSGLAGVPKTKALERFIIANHPPR